MIPAVVARDVWATVPRGSAAALVTTTSVDEPLIAPLAADQTIGQVTIKDDASLVTSVPLVPQKAVAEGGWWSQLTDTVALWMR